MCNGDAVDREERRDDEELDEFFGTTWKANIKEGFDIFRGDDRHLARVVLAEYLKERDSAQRRAEELHGQRVRQQEEQFQQRIKFAEETFALRMRDQMQSTAHRDLAISMQWRDQGRDSGESVFDPKQSS